MKTTVLMIAACCLAWVGLHAQVPDPDRLAADLASSVGESPADNGSFAGREDDWQEIRELAAEKLNLNTADENSLAALALPPALITSLIHYRNLLGPLVDVHELQAVPGWDVATARRLADFVYVSPVYSMREMFRGMSRSENYSLSLRFMTDLNGLNEQDGYTGSDSSRSFARNSGIRLRYRYAAGNALQYGVLCDKDPGEPFGGKNARAGFDFYSFHLFLRKPGMMRLLAVGDYTVCFGQGLIQYQGFAPYKGSDAIQIQRQAPALKPYRSPGEIHFYRGIGLCLQPGKMELTAFLSCRKLDARLTSDSGISSRVSYINNTGLHRTESEIRNKNSLERISWGGCMKTTRAGWKLGFNFSGHHFDLPLIGGDEPFQMFSFRGKNLMNLSVDYAKSIHNLHFFGEWAVSDFKGMAMVQGVMAGISAKTDFSLLYRKISRSYHSIESRAFTETGMPAPETGVFVGLRIKPSSRWEIQACSDHYYFPWLRYNASAPGRGSEQIFRLQYNQKKKLQLSGKFSCSSQLAGNSFFPQAVNAMLPIRKIQIHINFFLFINPQVRVEFGSHWIRVKSEFERGEEGSLFWWSVKYSGNSPKFSILASSCFFQTDSYASRVYLIEKESVINSGILSYQGRGYRFSGMMKLQFNRNNSIYFQVSKFFRAVPLPGISNMEYPVKPVLGMEWMKKF